MYKHFHFDVSRHFFMQYTIVHTQVSTAVHFARNLCKLLAFKNLLMLGMVFNTNSDKKIYNINNRHGKSNIWRWTSNNLFQLNISHDFTITMLWTILPCCNSHFLGCCHHCSLWNSILNLVLYSLFTFNTCSLLLNPVDHSVEVVVSANQLLQKNWLRENLTLLCRY